MEKPPEPVLSMLLRPTDERCDDVPICAGDVDGRSISCLDKAECETFCAYRCCDDDCSCDEIGDSGAGRDADVH